MKTGRLMAAVCLLLASAGGGYAEDKTDTKLWLAQKFSLALSSRFKARLDLNERFYSDASRWEEFYVDAALDYSPAAFLTLSPVYRQGRAKLNSAEEAREDRFHFNLDVKPRAGGLAFSFRSRYEYRIFADKIKHRFTERVKVSRPLPAAGWLRGASVYVSDELYYDIDLARANNNEVRLGLEWAPGRNTALELYYGHETKRSGAAWDYSTDIVGLETALKL